MATAGETLLSVRNLRTWFHTDAGVVKAVDGMSFDLRRGEVLAIVGESGSGKSVTAMSLMGLVPDPPGRIESGQVLWKGRDLVGLPEPELRQVRGGEIAVIFQDPMSSLNPVHTVGRQIAEMVRIHRKASRREAMERAIEMMELVGIPQARRRSTSYPHEFSGGMRQRVMIAMALSCEPDLLIADEPTTALDVTIQAQVIEVLQEIKERTGSAILLITHDLGVVAGMADQVLVMYAGKPVEHGSAADVFYRSQHPYTLGLLASLPRVDQGEEGGRLRPIEGNPPSLIHLSAGCSFHPRCPFSRLPAPCGTEEPALRGIDASAHRAACHFAEEVASVDPVSLRRSVGEPAVSGTEASS
ncbi:MAG TPA: ABC transporter ATP-binding protein [Acidimicrobiales bacterium]|nr:ABC transporter ATP-binding protein [Acidimicrobiales bacterium]